MEGFSDSNLFYQKIKVYFIHITNLLFFSALAASSNQSLQLTTGSGVFFEGHFMIKVRSANGVYLILDVPVLMVRQIAKKQVS